MTSTAHDRRSFLGVVLSGSAFLALGLGGARSVAAQGKPKLHVFVVTEIQSHALQELLVSAMPGVEIVAFGRFRDFETALDDKPDAVLCPSDVLKAKGLRTTVTGSSGSGVVEPYVLMALGANVDPAKVATVGAVDVLGRQGMQRVASELLGGAPNVERVNKVQDLLPMLQLSSADAVLLPERLAPALQSRSKQTLHITKLKGGLGLPSVAVLSGMGSGAAEAIRSLNADVCRKMGVSKWD